MATTDRFRSHLLDLNRPGKIGIAWVAGTVREHETRWVERDQRLRRAARERLIELALISSCVCPEPVLVKRPFLYKKRKRKDGFLTCGLGALLLRSRSKVGRGPSTAGGLGSHDAADGSRPSQKTAGPHASRAGGWRSCALPAGSRRSVLRSSRSLHSTTRYPPPARESSVRSVDSFIGRVS